MLDVVGGVVADVALDAGAVTLPPKTARIAVVGGGGPLDGAAGWTADTWLAQVGARTLVGPACTMTSSTLRTRRGGVEVSTAFVQACDAVRGRSTVKTRLPAGVASVAILVESADGAGDDELLELGVKGGRIVGPPISIVDGETRLDVYAVEPDDGAPAVEVTVASAARCTCRASSAAGSASPTWPHAVRRARPQAMLGSLIAVPLTASPASAGPKFPPAALAMTKGPLQPAQQRAADRQGRQVRAVHDPQQNDHADGIDAAITREFLEIVAPRWTLPPDQVLSTFPPNQAAGAFGTRLPQIVLRRRSLPWERPVKDQPQHTPYMALVVIADGEGPAQDRHPDLAVHHVGTHAAGTFNDATVGDALTVTYGRTSGKVFPDDLTMSVLLAHVREVDLTDTELALGDDDGSVGGCHRQPAAPARYAVHGLPDLVRGPGEPAVPSVQPVEGSTFPPLPPQRASLSDGEFTFPVFAHWSFTCTASGDFQSLVQDLDVGLIGTLPGPGAFTGRKPPPPPGRPRLGPCETVTSRLDHLTRDGEPEPVWYRGPLHPFPGTAGPVNAEGDAAAAAPLRPGAAHRRGRSDGPLPGRRLRDRTPARAR